MGALARPMAVCSRLALTFFLLCHCSKLQTGAALRFPDYSPIALVWRWFCCGVEKPLRESGDDAESPHAQALATRGMTAHYPRMGAGDGS